MDFFKDFLINQTVAYILSFYISICMFYFQEKYSEPFTFHCQLEGIKRTSRSSSMHYGDGVAMTTGNGDIQ